MDIKAERVSIRDLQPDTTLSPAVLVATIVTKSARRVSRSGYCTFFKVILADNTGEIDLCLFNEYLIFYDALELDRTYCFTGLKVDPRTKTQNATGLTHPAQLTTLRHRTFIAPTEYGGLLLYSFNPPPIATIRDMETEVAVDVIGICKVVHPAEERNNSITEEEFLMRQIVLEDETGEVTLALFGEEALRFSENNQGTVVGMKASMTTSWGPDGTRSLKATATSRLHLQPACTPRVFALMEWYRQRARME